MGSVAVVLGLLLLKNALTYESTHSDYSTIEPVMVGVVGVLSVSGGIHLLIRTFKNPAE